MIRLVRATGHKVVSNMANLRHLRPRRLGHGIGPRSDLVRLVDSVIGYLQALRETGAKGLEPATSGVT